MFDDLVVFGILAAGAILGAWWRPLRLARKRAWIQPARLNRADLEKLQILWRHPYLRLATLGTLLAVLSWAGLAARLGVSQAGTLAQSGVWTTPQQAQACHFRQQRLLELISSERAPNAVLPSQGELRLMPIRCPSGGEYAFNPRGVLSCSVHGTATPPAVIEPKHEF